MSAMQNVEKSQTSLKVPKLKLKLTQPFQNPVESEQSSTESDSESENENDDDDEENVPHEQGNASIDVDSNGKMMEPEQLPFSEHNVEVQQYPYNTNTNTSNCLTSAINNNNESLNESGSSTKNISTDSGEKSECVDGTYETQQHLSESLQNEFSQSNQLQILPSIPDIQPIQKQTENMVQTNVATDTIIKITVRLLQSKSFWRHTNFHIFLNLFSLGKFLSNTGT